jgi:deoxyribonuclease IV
MERRTGGGRRWARLPLVGAQVSTAGGFAPVPARAVALGAEVVQVFSSNPRTWRAEPPDPAVLASFAAALRELGLPLFLHTIYLINFASPDEQLRRRSAQALIHAVVTGAFAGAAGVVTHIGSHRGEGFESAAPLALDAISTALDRARRSLVVEGPGRHPAVSRAAVPPLLLETGAGSGATVGDRLDELAVLLAALPAGSGLCLDTAHLFAAGYPIHEADGLDQVIHDLRRLDLLDKVRLVHLNDSATPFASNSDRHANPGEGRIGYEGLARVVRHPALAHVPFVLEVPGPEQRGPSAAEVALVKTMRPGAPGPPRVPVPGAGHPEGPR